MSSTPFTMWIIATIAILFGCILSPVSAFGSTYAAGVIRINNCEHDIHRVAIYEGVMNRTSLILAANTTSFDPYAAPDNGGVSEKYTDESFSALGNDDPVVQFEYFVDQPSTDRIFGDLSLIDCGPGSDPGGHCVARQGGYVVSWPDWTGCSSIICPGGADGDTCTSAYNDWDDQATFTCVHGTDFANAVNTTLIFCPTSVDMELDLADY
jgi:hypothetical protein